ncbi:MAG TPA: ATP-dependent Clp protease proteolytic subunit [Pseudonocardia sp.]|nr:ATP-dependent Clp protease proteolytic subunit [Pseudonocardia sp.]
MGQAVSAAAFLLTVGQPGRRSAVQHARISITQPAFDAEESPPRRDPAELFSPGAMTIRRQKKDRSARLHGVKPRRPGSQ